MSKASRHVVIGMDPHKRSVTIEVMSGDESVVGTGRFGTDRDGLAELLRFVAAWPQRVWAIEGCSGIGRHVALHLLGQGEQVVDVPPKLAYHRGCRVAHVAREQASLAKHHVRGEKKKIMAGRVRPRVWRGGRCARRRSRGRGPWSRSRHVSRLPVATRRFPR